jgi:hypothetical protein
MDLHPAPYTVDTVLQTLRGTFRDYQQTRVRCVSDASSLSLLPMISSALSRVEQHLQYVAGQEILCERLDEIRVGGPGRPSAEWAPARDCLSSLSQVLPGRGTGRTGLGRDSVPARTGCGIGPASSR